MPGVQKAQAATGGRKKKIKKRNRPLLLSLDHGSNTITMGASRPTGCTAASYQSAQRTLALRRAIMDEFPGLILFLLLSERGALTALSVSVTPPPLHPTTTRHTHTALASPPLPDRVLFTLQSVHRLPALSVIAVLFSAALSGRPGAGGLGEKG